MGEFRSNQALVMGWRSGSDKGASSVSHLPLGVNDGVVPCETPAFEREQDAFEAPLRDPRCGVGGRIYESAAQKVLDQEPWVWESALSEKVMDESGEIIKGDRTVK